LIFRAFFPPLLPYGECDTLYLVTTSPFTIPVKFVGLFQLYFVPFDFSD
jgi:hypothetical protein